MAVASALVPHAVVTLAVVAQHETGAVWLAGQQAAHVDAAVGPLVASLSGERQIFRVDPDRASGGQRKLAGGGIASGGGGTVNRDRRACRQKQPYGSEEQMSCHGVMENDLMSKLKGFG